MPRPFHTPSPAAGAGAGAGAGATASTLLHRDSFELASLASSSSRSSSSPSGVSSSRRLSLDSNDQDHTSDNGDPTFEGGAGSGDSRARHIRSYSVSSSFDFNSHLIPLTGSSSYAPLPSTSGGGIGRGTGQGQVGHGGSPLERRKTLTFMNALALMLSVQIGSGIFSAPSQVNNHAGSPGVSLVIWLVAGLLSWTGAASFAELGGAIPLNGGAQAYLRYTYGEGLAFVFCWTVLTVLKPGGAAIVAIIFGEYFNPVIFGGEDVVGVWGTKMTAIVALLVVTALNGVSTKLTAQLTNLFMILKVGSLLAITVIGIVIAATGWNGDGTEPSTEWKDRNWFAPRTTGGGGNGTASENGHGDNNVLGSIELGGVALALYAGLWAFDGWDNVNWVIGEMRHPARDLPLVIHTAMPTVILCYLLANISYYLVLPSSVVSSSNAIAVVFGQKAFGYPGTILFALTVSMSCFGALNAGTFTSSRIVYVAGKEGYLPAVFGRLGWFTLSGKVAAEPQWSRPTDGFITRLKSRLADGPWHTTPIAAILLNTFTTILYVVIGSFSTLLTFYGVATYSFYFLTVLGLIILRVREPELERPYKTWIITPICFCCVSLFLITRGVFSAPVETVIVAAFVAMGWPLYYWRIGGGSKGFQQDVGVFTTQFWLLWSGVMGKGRQWAR